MTPLINGHSERGMSEQPTALDRSPTKGERIILTTYPDQVGIRPLPLEWGAADGHERGPILAARQPVQNLKRHNAIGAYGGSYCIYHALAVAAGELPSGHRPDYRLTEPMATIGPHPQWSEDPYRIVSLDPWGHLVPQMWGDLINSITPDNQLDIRPTIAITKAHMRIPELTGLTADGLIVTKGGDLVVTKAAVEPVWWLPGVAKRFGIEEAKLRRCLFEDTAGMYPELITRPDLQVFLPPIGGLTCYIFGSVERLKDPECEVTVRVHDECNGSDVFGSDICTCRPYLVHGVQLCVETAQRGGVGLIVYFRKEGRALGEVVKYLVYNARKRQEGGDRASTYFARTEQVAGVKDMRFQALMPDILHWLGIRHSDHFVSMSNMKYEAIVGAGIEIRERVSIPPSMLPDESHVEIEAKLAAGYFTGGGHHLPTPEELERVKGRDWDDIQH